MIRKKNKPIKVKQTTLDEAEVFAVIAEWGKGQGIEETKHLLLLPDALVTGVYLDCNEVQDECDKSMRLETPPATERALKDIVELLGVFKSEDMVDAVVKHSDIDDNGDWDMYKEYDWEVE